MSDRWASFDCYGTLIDWERGITDAFRGLWPNADAMHLLERYHEFEPVVQAGSGMPYRDVLREVLVRVAGAEDLALGDDQRDALSASLPEWPPFAEVPDSLGDLKTRGWKLAILSNCDPDLLASSVLRLQVPVDATVTVADSGSYKPARGHWDTFFASTGADRSRHVHVARSLFHDIAPCAELGLVAVWIDRADEPTDLPMAGKLPDLRGLGDTLDALVGA